MLPQSTQNGQQTRSAQQQPFIPSSSSPHSMNFDGPSHMNLDSNAVAKQMASLTAVGMARMAKMPPGPSAVHPQVPLGASGTSSGFNLGAMQSHSQSIGHDNNAGTSSFGTMSAYPNFQSSSNGTMPPQQLANANNPFLGEGTSNGSNRHAPPAATLKQRQRNFLNGLASVMSAKNTPLPPSLTGVPDSQYDPNKTMWNSLEPSSEIGAFKLAGKDIDLFRLWGLVFQAGGHEKMTNTNSWGQLLVAFDLPEQTTITQGNGQSAMQSVARVLQHYYVVILGNFEGLYRKNVMEQQRKQQAAQGQGGDLQARGVSGSQQQQPGMHGSPQYNQQIGLGGPTPGVQPLSINTNGNIPYPLQLPQSPHKRQPSATPSQADAFSAPSPSSSYPPPPSTPVGDGEQDGSSNKRKLGSEEPEAKRARQKTGSEPPENLITPATPTVDRSSVPPIASASVVGSSSMQIPPLPTALSPQPKRQLSRRKIEYAPLERELESYGGRDVRALEEDWSQRKPLRDVNEWGRVDIEAVTMSLRSRIPTEVSYALTTLSLISTMKGQTPGTGFPIAQCEDLMEEMLDFLEDEAFGEVPDGDETPLTPEGRIITHREIINAISEEELRHFASMHHHQGVKDRTRGPGPRPAHSIMVVMNVVRNLTMFSDNHPFMASHERLLDLFLRISTVTVSSDGSIHALSPSLSLSDLVVARRDTIHTIFNLAHMFQMASGPGPMGPKLRMASRAFDLMASYVVDSADAVSPVTYVKQVGMPHAGPIRPPTLPDTALQVFGLLGQPDSNRQIFAHAVSQARIWTFFEALIHRLPVADLDFQLMTQELWLGYLEKVIMAIYALAFLSPPKLKKKIKADWSLGFGRVMLRMVQKFLLAAGVQGRQIFIISARRAIETMKIIDDGKDSFDTSQSNTTTLSFGMGWNDGSDNGPEKGTGLLGGHLDVTWDILMQREVEEPMFSELESLARVE